MIGVFSSFILGIIEGFTEFLPISSTAHLNLASRLLGLEQTEYLKAFGIIIQGGAILAVLFFYWRRFLDWEVLKRVIVAFLPTGLIGLLLYPVIKTFFLGNTSLTVSSLALGGILLIVFEKFHPKTVTVQDVGQLSYAKAFTVGIFQSFAVIPGVSRAAATIVGGMVMGLERGLIVEFSFLLAVPTILAAAGFDLIQNVGVLSSGGFGYLAIGLITSFLAALVSIKFLLSYIRKHTFVGFGIYRILLVIVFVLLATL